MTTFIYTSSPTLTLTSGMGVGLNALANNAMKIAATTLDNTSSRHFYANAYLFCHNVDLSAQTNPAVELYLVPESPITNIFGEANTYDGFTSSNVYPPSTYLNGVFPLTATKSGGLYSGGQHAILTHMIIDPIKYKPIVINKTGAALAATSNTLTFGTYTTFA
jgi:hypothetical protein